MIILSERVQLQDSLIELLPYTREGGIRELLNNELFSVIRAW